MGPSPTTLVALGASNLTRGFATVVNTARAAWGEPIEILAALGHGRAYGMRSSFLFRSLPGIRECGLWRQLDALPQARIRALVTDIGNDVLYGAAPDALLAWVQDCVTRLQSRRADVTIMGLPLENARRVSNARYLFFRSLLVPSCRLGLAEVLARCEALDAGVAELARAAGLRLVRQRPEWYGLDPLHIRPRLWAAAWREILLGESAATDERGRTPGQKPLGRLRLYLAAPERRRLFGVERTRVQPALRTSGGTRLWLY
jgi:hypothetical protein